MGTEQLQLIIDVAWVAAYNVGADAIDAEHGSLFEMLDRMREAYAAEQDALCLALIKDFAAAVRSHFAREEAIFTTLPYPGAQRHIAQHAVLALRAQAISKAAERTSISRHSLADLIDGLAAVVITDHLTLDLELRQYLP